MSSQLADDIERREAFLAAIIDSSDDAIISKNLNSIITSWNKAAERMFGYREDEAIGKHVFLIIPKELQGEEEMIIGNLRQGKRIEHFETVRVTKGGQRLHLSLTISPIKNSQGEVIGASKIARDITRQRTNELKIRSYAQQLEAIHEVGKTISTKLEASAIINSVIESTMQLSEAEIGIFLYRKKRTRKNYEILCASRGVPKSIIEQSQAFKKLREDELGDAFTSRASLTTLNRFDRLFPLKEILQPEVVKSNVSIPVLSQKGEFVGMLYFAHHESDKFSEESIRTVQAIASIASIALDNANLYDEVQQVSTRKDEFIGFASHELKTPLTTLLGYIDLLKIDPNQAELYIQQIERQAMRIKGLIFDLFDISQIQSGTIILKRSPTLLSSLIREALESIRGEQHVMKFEVPNPDVLINIDKDKIVQVLCNLLGNAVKYSNPETTIFISGRSENDQIVISVKDEGPGISDDDKPYIFNQFYRSSKLTHIPGMGIGLYISREIIRQHEGEIQVESILGEGTTFRVLLPTLR